MFSTNPVSPRAFQACNSRLRGWKVSIPGGRPLATPAVVNGGVFLGGGFGSHEFYAFDLNSGCLRWQYHTKDDGPTAAIVLDDLVIFNTESCELEVLTVTGRPVWKHWLGDPLMSIPAAGQGRVFMVYPDSRGDRRHYLACFELRTGKDLWRQPIAGEVITTPVLAEDKVYLSTLDGTLACFQREDGKPMWQERQNATSSPVVWREKCYYSRRQERPHLKPGMGGSYQTESVTMRGATPKSAALDFEATRTKADWLDYQKRKGSSRREKMYESYDGAVGFGGYNGDAKMFQAMGNLGHGTVAGIWAYQGSKPFIYRNRLYTTMGQTVQCLDPNTEALTWKQTVSCQNAPTAAAEDSLLDHVLTPPAMANGKVFVGTVFGDLLCLGAETGQVIWQVALGEPIVFQPAVAQGRVVVATSTGSLFCLETGDPRDDGWLMWGANPRHNGGE